MSALHRIALWSLLAWLAWLPAHGAGQILEVGPNRGLKTPSDAARVARDGALVIFDPGIYMKDAAVWPQNDLTLMGAGGRVMLMAQGVHAQGKAIWVIKGDRVTVEGIDFSGARVDDLNGAGIRFEGTDLTIRRCRFYDNQMGLLTGANPASSIRIEGSEFYRNTVDYQRHGRLGHNIYIGAIRRFELIGSHVHRARTGHLVKSRARENLILYNRITDESGRASYLVDLADGGQATIMGNLLHKSAAAENQTAISFASENNRTLPGQSLYVIANTLVSDHPAAVLVTNHSGAETLVANNLIQGRVRVLDGPGRTLSNLVLEDAGLQDAKAFDYRLRPDSLALDAGAPRLTDPQGKPLVPKSEYQHPRSTRPRPDQGNLDAGAYEFVPEEVETGEAKRPASGV